jgi:hypothetical protein
MNRHPDIRQLTTESTKWKRWRRVQFQRHFPGSIGSEATEAIVSGFLNKFQPVWRTAMASETFLPSH